MNFTGLAKLWPINHRTIEDERDITFTSSFSGATPPPLSGLLDQGNARRLLPDTKCNKENQ
jgi:hypothetical protein